MKKTTRSVFSLGIFLFHLLMVKSEKTDLVVFFTHLLYCIAVSKGANMASTQMNIRIDEAVKKSGDAVFAHLGYSPTSIVRLIWGYAAHNKNKPAQVKNLLHEVEQALSPDADAERAKRIQLADAGPQEFLRFLSNMGVDCIPQLEDETSSAADIREQAALERARKKGWLDE